VRDGIFVFSLTKASLLVTLSLGREIFPTDRINWKLNPSWKSLYKKYPLVFPSKRKTRSEQPFLPAHYILPLSPKIALDEKDEDFFFIGNSLFS